MVNNCVWCGNIDAAMEFLYTSFDGYGRSSCNTMGHKSIKLCSRFFGFWRLLDTTLRLFCVETLRYKPQHARPTQHSTATFNSDVIPSSNLKVQRLCIYTVLKRPFIHGVSTVQLQ
ncbi:uncharacterized protein LOC100574446 [Acyrthosiphon pisum]|uniref:Uncharacterized protein n=1 Tax=Acyrthosiphon pisum TaxID=7029 RepID=A0A8R2NW73_ACYPI|nr:uncharacterized protein LOC100574446 [Acyrthosiphon pisum]